MHAPVSRGPKSRSMVSSVLFIAQGYLNYSLHSQLIFRYVTDKYGLEIGPPQTTQLNKAIAHGAEKGTFALPKGKSTCVYLRFGAHSILV